MERNTDVTSLPWNTASPLLHYLKQRNIEYKSLYKGWLNGTSRNSYAPTTWPHGRCMLIGLPLELVLLICNRLYQADLLHLALTCRTFANIAIPLMYTRDVADFDCLALRWACTFGIAATLERSLSFGASPSHVFSAGSHVKCRWVLTEPVTSPFSAHILCGTPLSAAIVANEPEIVRLLIEHGVDVNAPDPKASDMAYSQYFEILFPINFAMGTPDMLDFPAFQPGNTQIVRRLLEAGADPNQYTFGPTPHYPFIGFEGFTPLLMAMQPQVPVETVELLLEYGADPTARGSYEGRLIHDRLRPGFDFRFHKLTPLRMALYCSQKYNNFPLDLEKIRVLLMHGAADEVSYISGGPDTRHPLPILYRYWDHPQIAAVLKLFIAHEVDVARWAAALIPPIISVIWWVEQTIWMCEKNGAVHQTWIALNKACELITLLAEATVVENPTTPTRKSSIIDSVVRVPSPAIGLAVAADGQTALRYLCRPPGFVGTLFLIRLLLRYGADMNSPDAHGRTALHHASTFSRGGDQVRELIEFQGGPAASGLVIDAFDSRSWTPLHYACLFRSWDEPSDRAVAAARLLLESGADVRARTSNGWTPLSLAAFSASPDLVHVLLDHGAHADDLLLSRLSRNAEPTLVPIGRIVFLHWDYGHRLIDLLPEVMNELAVRRARVATLLEHRLGISVPLPPMQEQAVRPLGSRLDPQAPAASLPKFFVDRLEHPFGIAVENYGDLAADDFEKDLDGVLDVLDPLGLEALVVPVSDPIHRPLIWLDIPVNASDHLSGSWSKIPGFRHLLIPEPEGPKRCPSTITKLHLMAVPPQDPGNPVFNWWLWRGAALGVVPLYTLD
ncbi:ankyrin repeat-containing domain protein [Thermothelomyces heterothallicus CBS 202.75]|uniref:ankyrin repeat-containing domain protein n=1 Tax=Thermothelomyces heterothallicus CBS 202.75 TaxID=1149848 RepID=UPI0037444797